MKVEAECTCPSECDCESPDTNPAGISNSCPEHNWRFGARRPDPAPDCPIHVAEPGPHPHD